MKLFRKVSTESFNTFTVSHLSLYLSYEDCGQNEPVMGITNIRLNSFFFFFFRNVLRLLCQTHETLSVWSNFSSFQVVFFAVFALICRSEGY